MKNYYDELEVSKTASKEVIEKAYKVLAKKYHPDITQEADKKIAEEKFKIISEAYEILSDDEKRKKYDLELEQSSPNISYEDYMNMVNERDSLNNSLNNLKKQYNQYGNSNYSSQQNYNNQQNSNFNNSGYNNSYTNSTAEKKKTYYYTSTGQPASVFDYYRYKIKKFFSNIGFFLLATLAILLMINAILPIDLIGFLLY